MRRFTLILSALFLITFSLKAQQKTVGVHLMNFSNDNSINLLRTMLPDLKEMGINTIFLEVDYNFDFESHPELAAPSTITKYTAKRLAKTAKEEGIRIIPEFQHIGHQSWAENTQVFLTKYPQYDLTPGAYPNNKGIYCREWDLTNKKIDTIVFSLVDEIVAAFEADAIHIGADEVFLIGDEKSPSTKGKNPAELYAAAITRFHDHYSKKNKLEMFMWGDRLIDAYKYGYGSWEASTNGTAPAVDMIPKDIVICDWHYVNQSKYPSVDMFIQKGFKVLPTSFKDVEAASALIKYSYGKNNDNMVGHMFSMWGTVKPEAILSFKSMQVGTKLIKEKRFNDPYITALGFNKEGSLEIELSSPDTALPIRYTVDGTDVNANSSLYTSPIKVSENTLVKALVFKDGKPAGEQKEKEFVYHKAIGARVIDVEKPSAEYASGNSNILTNGINETVGYQDGEWIGYNGNNMEVVLDLKNPTLVSSVSINFNNTVNSWIHHPNEVYVYGSTDGENYQQISYLKKRKTGRTVVNFKLNVEQPSEFKFLKIKAVNQKIPEGFNGAGSPAWIFADEIQVF